LVAHPQRSLEEFMDRNGTANIVGSLPGFRDLQDHILVGHRVVIPNDPLILNGEKEFQIDSD